MPRTHDSSRQVTLTVPADPPPTTPEPTGIRAVDALNATISAIHVDGDAGDEHPHPDQTGPGDADGDPLRGSPRDDQVDAPQAQADPAAAMAAAGEAPVVYTLGDRLLSLERDGQEGEQAPTVKIGDMVLYHGRKGYPPTFERGDHPAIVTAMLPPEDGGAEPALWLTVLLPHRVDHQGAVHYGPGGGQWS